jgi:ribonuclease HI
MYFDGSKRVQGSGAGVVLISPQGDKLKYVLRMSFPQASNNEAVYEALLHGMKMAKACGATRLKIFGDSNLVVQQLMNHYDAVSENMTAYRNLHYTCKELLTDVKSRISAEPATRKPIIWQTSGLIACPYRQESFGRKSSRDQ